MVLRGERARESRCSAAARAPGALPLVAACGRLAARARGATVSVMLAGAARVGADSKPRQSSGLEATRAWSHQLAPSDVISQGSPSVATLAQGVQAVVVGADSGHVFAFSLDGGIAVSGWPVQLPEGVWSTPSVAPLGPQGTDWVFVADGTAQGPGGGIYAIQPNGQVAWSYDNSDPDDPNEAFVGSPAIGNLTGSGQPTIAVGSVGLLAYAIDAASGQVDPGWPIWQADTNFSTAALADLFGNGGLEMVIGDDSSPGGYSSDPRFAWVPGGATWAGGLVRALDGSGHTLWVFRTDEVVQSSPAIGDLFGTGTEDVVFGTGHYWYDHGGSTDAGQLFVVNGTNGQEIWQRDLGGDTTPSPALADLLGNGQLDVIEGVGSPLGTWPPTGGAVWAFAPNGSVLPGWPVTVQGGLIGSVVTADLLGNGKQEVLVPTTQGLEVLGSLAGPGSSVGCPGIAQPIGLQNSPLVTVDPDGNLGITLAGYDEAGGVIEHYTVTTSHSLGARSWPMFHHDPELTGAFPRGLPACLVPPPGATQGYWLATLMGGVYTFGDARFFGSEGNRQLASPINAIAATPDGGGYWLVGVDGGVFALGDAGFVGSVPGLPASERPPPGIPFVGIAPTPDGGGYWLVNAAGDVYTFGDARFFGSAGSMTLVAPIAAMAATPDGEGYWLVGIDGGIFAFGDASYEGSLGCVGWPRWVVGIAVVR
jgi:hypothetical protein